MNTSRILRCLKTNENFLLRMCKTPKLQRDFLSEAYQCQEAWDKRLESPLLKKVKPVDFFLELDQRLQSQNRISAVDIDILANCINDSSHNNELADILHKLRNTRETTFTLESTHHAVVRYYLKVNMKNKFLYKSSI